MRTEQLYEAISEKTAQGLDKFKVEDFRPCLGTVLIALPPRVKKIGSIHLTERTADQVQPNYGRVVAVPLTYSGSGIPGTPCGMNPDRGCPVHPGQWVIFRAHTGDPVEFSGRSDLVLLNYSDDSGSDILGWSDVGPEEEENHQDTKTLREKETGKEGFGDPELDLQERKVREENLRQHGFETKPQLQEIIRSDEVGEIPKEILDKPEDVTIASH